jgi:glycosyltransferase involved in cell wall biosynthesis
MKISLLSPVRNEAAHLGQMIESVRAQSHQDWEMLLVDDRSTDSSHSIMVEAARRDPRIDIVPAGSECGKVAAFNRAYMASHGDVIALLAGDDVLPPDALARRAAAFDGIDITDRVVAFFKLRTFSEDVRYNGMVLPRGNASSRSGGSITMSRSLADIVFPIDETLRSEDIWLGHAAADLASTVIERPDIVLLYRIHPGNSHVRGQSFPIMNEFINTRHQSYRALLDHERLGMSNATRIRLERLWRAEQSRYAGRTFDILFRSKLPTIDRLAIAAQSRPSIYIIRTRFYRLFSGLRGR